MKKLYLAKWDLRFWAWLVDFIIVGIFISIVFNLLGYSSILEFRASHLGSDFGITSLVFLVYWTILEGYKGQSIGKMALGIRMVDKKTGGRMLLWQSFVSAIGKAFLLPIDCLIGWLAMPGSKLRLFNRVSDTVVIEAKQKVKRVKYVKRKR